MNNANSPPAVTVTPAAVEAAIATEHYFNAHDAASAHTSHTVVSPGANLEASEPRLAVLTICVLVLHNGFMVMGQSACVDPASFDPGTARFLARHDAFDRLCPLLAFQLREQLAANAARGQV